MVQIVKRPRSLGEQLGQAVAEQGQRAMQIFPAIGQAQAQQQQQQKLTQALEGLGFGSSEAGALGGLPEPILQTVLKQLSQRGYMGAPQPGDALAGLEGAAEQAAPSQQVLQDISQQLSQAPGMRGMGFAQPQTAAEALRMPTRQEQREEEKLSLQERKILGQEKAQERQAIREAYKDTAPYRTKVLDDQKEARNVMDDLARFKALETQDTTVDTPGYIEFLKRSGLDIPALMKPESEEFMKLRQSFLRDARKIFGGRVTNFEMEQFLKSIPDLSMSPQGRKRVIANMEKLNRLKIKEGDIMRKVIKENKNVPPPDLAEQVAERLENERESISEQFKKDLRRPVPAPQNRLVTATQAVIGSVLGAPGTVLGGIGKLFGGGA